MHDHPKPSLLLASLELGNWVWHWHGHSLILGWAYLPTWHQLAVGWSRIVLAGVTGANHDWSRPAQACVNGNHREATEQTKTSEYFSKPLFNSHCSACWHGWTSQGLRRNISLKGRRALKSYMAKCVNTGWVKNGVYWSSTMARMRTAIVHMKWNEIWKKVWGHKLYLDTSGWNKI